MIMFTKIELPVEGFKSIIQYRGQSVYFFRFDLEETENETYLCNETTTFLEDATYETMVDALIGVKYPISAQLALLYNYEADKEAYVEQMEIYQNWRAYCKDSAREFFGIEA